MSVRRTLATTSALALSIVLAACSGAAPPPASSPASGAPTAAATVGGAGEAKSFTLGLGSLGISTMVLKAAAAELADDGYTIDSAVIEPEVSVEGVSNGQFAFGTSGNSTALLAMQSGSDIKFVIDNIANEWSLFAASGIAACADLDGKRIGIFSEGGVSTAMVKNYIETECPDAEPTYLVLGDSPTRAAALLAGELDATPVELSDAITLEKEGEGSVHRLASFAEATPELKTTSVYANADFIAQNPTTTRAFVTALLEQYRRIDGDPEYLKEITLEHYPEVDAETLDAAAEAYANGGYFPVDGGLTAESLEYTIGFFEEAGVLEPALTAEAVADLSFLEAALEELGPA